MENNSQQAKGLEEKFNTKDIFMGIKKIIISQIKDDFNFKKHPIGATFKTLFVGAMGCAMYLSLQNGNVENYNRQLTREISILADRNNDGAVLSEEWARVYQELGVRYDVHSSNPFKDLTIEQKENYIQNHK